MIAHTDPQRQLVSLDLHHQGLFGPPITPLGGRRSGLLKALIDFEIGGFNSSILRLCRLMPALHGLTTLCKASTQDEPCSLIASGFNAGLTLL